MKHYKVKMKLKNILIILGVILSFYSCNKEENILEDPYAGGKEPFGIKLFNDLPDPPSGPPGTEVTFHSEGLVGWNGQFDFFINNELAEVLNVTDSTVTVKVPDKVSSGESSIIMDGQVFFGPRFQVEGNVVVDPNFGLVEGTQGPIYDYIEHSNGYLLVGSFNDIENLNDWWRGFNGMALINSGGQVVEDFNNEMRDMQVGPMGYILSVSRLSNGEMIISGSFNEYNGISGMSGITRINEDGTIDSEEVRVRNPTPENPENGITEAPVFNGGAPDQVIVKSFVTPDDHIIAVGDLSAYGKVDYSRSTAYSLSYNYTDINTVMKLNQDGDLEESYHADAAGANGSVLDAYMEDDGKVVLVGDFTNFDGEAAGGIVRLNHNGDYDQNFKVGSGADGSINSVEYNRVAERVVITGNFNNFNGEPHNGVVVLKENGEIDEEFELREYSGGRPNFAAALDNGRIVLSGNFENYDGITRGGFLILESNGEVQQYFNMAGQFRGEISKVIETTSALDRPALILMGSISRFDDQSVGNIVQIEVQE